MIDLQKLWSGLYYHHDDGAGMWIDPSYVIYIRLVKRHRIDDENTPEEIPLNEPRWVELTFNTPAGLVAFFFPNLEYAEQAVDRLITERVEQEKSRHLIGPALFKEMMS